MIAFAEILIEKVSIKSYLPNPTVLLSSIDFKDLLYYKPVLLGVEFRFK